MNVRTASTLPYVLGLALGALLLFCYFFRLEADSIAGIFGIFYSDEGPYLLSAKHQALFGAAHFFGKDAWRPEVIAPLLHQYALLTITPENPVWLMRFGIAVQVVLGMGLIAWIAGKEHGGRHYALACFLCLLLNPVLFFYARVGLSESIQFLILALVLALLFLLHRTGSFRQAALLCIATGALAALLLIAKIGSLAACVGCDIGVLLTLYRHTRLPRRILLAELYVLAALAVLYGYFGSMTGAQLETWWDTNIAMHASTQMSLDIGTMFTLFLYKLPHLSYYLALMPIFAWYALSLLVAADRKDGFTPVLLAFTLTVLLIEVVSMGTIRRNFFGLSLLSILCGFTCVDYWRNGIGFSFRTSWLKIVGALLIVLYAAGAVLLLRWSIQQHDTIYIIFCSLFLAVFAMLLLAGRRAHFIRLRALMLLLLVVASLAPMLFQAFFTPNTRREINAGIESLLPEDAVILGSLAPWYLQGLKRKMVFNNCMAGDTALGYANDFGNTPAQEHTYFIGDADIRNDPCTPADTSHYGLIGKFRLFIPENYGGFYGTSDNWQYTRYIYLYEKF